MLLLLPSEEKKTLIGKKSMPLLLEEQLMVCLSLHLVLAVSLDPNAAR